MFVVNFNEKVSLGLPAAMPFSDRPDELEARHRETPADGRDRLYDAVARALDRLQSGALGKESADRHQRWRRQCERARLAAV